MLCACAACSPSRGATGATVDASVEAAAEEGGFGASPCGQCLAASCTFATSRCAEDPDCAAWLACVDACGTTDAGGADPTCAAACPRGTSSAGALAIEQVAACGSSGQGLLCGACPADAGEELNPLLRNVCPRVDDAGSACADCPATHCCQTYAACDQNCLGFTGCISDGGFYLDCDKQFPGGRVAAEAREVCYEIFCCNAAACATCGLQDPCNQCVLQECPAEYANFRATEAGSLYNECAAETMDGAACLAKYPEAQSVFTAFQLCVYQNCPSCAP